MKKIVGYKYVILSERSGRLKVINKYRSQDVTCVEGRYKASIHYFRSLLQLSTFLVVVPEVNEYQNDGHEIEKHVENKEDDLK